MADPTWLGYSFAVAMLAVSLYCIGRLVLAKRLGRHNHYDVSAGHVVMGVGMAGMLVPRWNWLPTGLLEVLFGIIGLYFLAMSARFVVAHGWRGTDDAHAHHVSHYLIHMLMAAAMLYMYWLGMPVRAGSGMGGATMSMSGPAVGAGDPSLTLAFMLILFASAAVEMDKLVRYSPGGDLAFAVAGGGAVAGGRAGASAAGGSVPGTEVAVPWLAPRLEIACHVAMCVTMGYMLMLMV